MGRNVNCYIRLLRAPFKLFLNTSRYGKIPASVGNLGSGGVALGKFSKEFDAIQSQKGINIDVGIFLCNIQYLSYFNFISIFGLNIKYLNQVIK